MLGRRRRGLAILAVTELLRAIRARSYAACDHMRAII